jgi:hypothetical protein
VVVPAIDVKESRGCGCGRRRQWIGSWQSQMEVLLVEEDRPSRVHSNGNVDVAVLSLSLASGVTIDMAFNDSAGIML